ncbi:MAG: response regulator transcription factor [Gemmatimonadaceae bacterium]|nr:response regulator transcription factor [Gemmatimonadaceae bacterium]
MGSLAATGPTAAPAPLHVLVADDEPHIGRIIKTKLEQGPFAVTLVYDGAEALAELERDPDIRLLILDLMMPRVNGLEVLDRVRGDARWTALPCLVLTAAGHDHHEADARRRGASDFMTKPFSPKRLLARAADLTATALP